MGTDNFLGRTQTIAAGAFMASVRALVAGRGGRAGAGLLGEAVSSTTGALFGTEDLLLLQPPVDGAYTVYGLNTDVDSGTVPEYVMTEDAVGGANGVHGVAASDTLALEAVSTSANDAVGGSGAQYLIVTGLEAQTGAPVAVRFNLNGVTAVTGAPTTTVKFARVQTAVCYPAANAGVITVRAVNGSNSGSVVGSILAGNGRFHNSWFHVPLGFVGTVRSVTATCETASGAATLGLYVSDIDGDRLVRTLRVTDTAPYESKGPGALATVGELGTAYLKVTASTDNTRISSTLTVGLAATGSFIKSSAAIVDKLRELASQFGR